MIKKVEPNNAKECEIETTGSLHLSVLGSHVGLNPLAEAR